jgi:hypothetical protein
MRGFSGLILDGQGLQSVLLPILMLVSFAVRSLSADRLRATWSLTQPASVSSLIRATMSQER